jgi:hypothetical protein
VYDLFTDNSRVHEYNEYCKDVQDLEWLDEHTKITHSRTGRPFSRDFVTRVHYRRLDADTHVLFASLLFACLLRSCPSLPSALFSLLHSLSFFFLFLLPSPFPLPLVLVPKY